MSGIPSEDAMEVVTASTTPYHGEVVAHVATTCLRLPCLHLARSLRTLAMTRGSPIEAKIADLYGTEFDENDLAREAADPGRL